MPDIGSSPLARGLPLGAAKTELGDRIIPARAGFTALEGRGSALLRDHPRSRGVYKMRRRRACTPSGSSPLARGLRELGRLLPAVERIIPARAGFTHAHRRLRRPHRDHPRSRGVYDVRPDDDSLWEGSSPLARGLLHNI